MGYELWNHGKFLSHKVRNMTRRGWLLKTYNDGKLLKGRVKTGEKIENDDLDIMHPVGMVAHVEPGEKMEIFTMDVGGDTSRRVISQVIGDREEHPQPDENETYFYAPNDKKMFIRFKKKRSQQQQARASNGQSQGRTKESGREPGMHWDGEEEKTSGQTKNTFQHKADKGMGHKTDANFDIKAANATQFEAGKHTRKGTTYRDGDTFTNGSEHAGDHVAGGGAVVGSLPSGSTRNRMGQSNGLPEGTPDGSQAVQAQGIPGSISLKGMAAAMGMASVDSGGGGQPSGGGMMQQMKDDKEELLRRIEALEARVRVLEGFHGIG